jgi:hypothetical protein
MNNFTPFNTHLSRFLIIAGPLLLASLSAGQAEQSQGVLKYDGPVMGSNAFSWVSQSGTVVRMYPPRLSFQDQTTKVQVHIGLDLASQSNTPRSAVLKYNFIPDAKPTRVGGTCEVKVTLSENSLEDVLLYNVHLTFDEPIRSDLITEYSFEVRDKFAPRIMLPELNGYVRSYPVKSDHAGQAHFLLGYNSAAGGPSLALPAVNLEFDRSMAIATDPYCGAAFRVNHPPRHRAAISVLVAGGTMREAGKRCGLKDSAAASLKRRIAGDLLEFFGLDVIRRLLGGCRPDWESDLRMTRERHLHLCDVGCGLDVAEPVPC